jgi:predicted membrane channel-forming protein YqfA (hemolysin III family)
MNTLQRIPAVFLFEWRRALTMPRLAWMVALMAFPPVLLLMIRTAARSDPPLEIAAILVYVLSPCVACMMSVFLWATPVLSAELEGRSWVYLAVRPYGPVAVLLGKYLVSVSWAVPVGLVSASLGAIVIGHEHLVQLVTVECGLATLSCLSYSAVFLLIGVILPKRAMVAGIVYAVTFEVAAALIPAAVNLFTIQYRLRCLLVRWMEMDVAAARGNPVFVSYFGDESAAWHVAVLLGMTAGYLAAAALLLRFREFTSAAETES